jgi:oligoendopeptidase F
MTNTAELPKWELHDLYQSLDAPEVERDIASANSSAEYLEKYMKGKIASLSGDDFAKMIGRYEEIEEILGRLASFAYLKYAEDMSNEVSSRFYQNTYEKINDISSKILFFTLEINRIDEADLAAKKLASRKLNHYAPWLRDIRSFKPYQLSDEAEQIFLETSQTSNASWSRLFDETLADLRFDYDGESLTCTEILNKLSSKDENERKKAAKSLGKTLADNSRIFAYITNVLAKDKSISDKWRGFEAPISSRNVSNFIEDEVVDALLTSVKASYPKLSHRYYKIKAKWMGKEKLDYWDRNAPLPDDESDEMPWLEATELVIDAYNEFSPELAKIGKLFFENNWIDVGPRDGKDSGAFAHPTVPSAHPYLLLNYQGKVRDVMTLAHELGHGCHQVLAAKQGPLMCDTPLTLAETASVFGEQLTFRKILDNESDPKKRKIIIANKIEDMLNTVVRQVAFCEFERVVHDERKNGEISVDRLNEIWMDIQRESLGDAIKFDDDYKHYWAYIPHFIHSPFYVYSYAFGDCLVNALYAKYLEQPDGFQEKYFAMLEAGGTLHHKELLEPFGLDATDPDFWQKGLDIISDFIDELEE